MEHIARTFAKAETKLAKMASTQGNQIQAQTSCPVEPVTITCGAQVNDECDDFPGTNGTVRGCANIETVLCLEDATRNNNTGGFFCTEVERGEGVACTSDNDCHEPVDAGFSTRNLICHNSECTYQDQITPPAGCHQVGDTCILDTDCAFGTCTGGVCAGVGLGEQCSDIRECGLGEWCYQNTFNNATAAERVCTAQVGFGEPLNIYQVASCPSAFPRGNSTSDLTCASFKDFGIFSRTADEACIPSDYRWLMDVDSAADIMRFGCAPNFYCDTEANKCVAEPSVIGDPCTLDGFSSSGCEIPAGQSSFFSQSGLGPYCSCSGGGNTAVCTAFPCYSQFETVLAGSLVDTFQACDQREINPLATLSAANGRCTSNNHRSGDFEDWVGSCKSINEDCGATRAAESCNFKIVDEQLTNIVGNLDNFCGIPRPTGFNSLCSSAAATAPTMALAAALVAVTTRFMRA